MPLACTECLDDNLAAVFFREASGIPLGRETGSGENSGESLK